MGLWVGCLDTINRSLRVSTLLVQGQVIPELATQPILGKGAPTMIPLEDRMLVARTPEGTDVIEGGGGGGGGGKC